MASTTSKATIIDNIKALLVPFLPDIADAVKGEMNLYSSIKNMRFTILNKQKVTAADYKKFTDSVDELKPNVAVFISCECEIPFEVKTNPLQFYVTDADLTDRFMEMLGAQPDVTQIQKAIATIAQAKKKPQVAKIDGYQNNEEGFNLYVSETAPSKIEFEKAKKKWDAKMTALDCTTRDKFIAYVKKVHDDAAAAPTGTMEQFNIFIKSTPISKITKSAVRTQFGNLPDEITHLDKPSTEFTKLISDYKKTLTGK